MKRPEELLPLLSYYEYYNDKQGSHLRQKDWTKLNFYKSIDGRGGSSFYDTNYKFYLHNDEAIFSWFLSAVSEDGKKRMDKLGGRVNILTNEFTCVEGLKAKFYLEDNSSITLDVQEKFSCELSKGFGFALSYDDLERLSASKMKAVRLLDERSAKSILFAVDNSYMKEYFKALKLEWEKL